MKLTTVTIILAAIAFPGCGGKEEFTCQNATPDEVAHIRELLKPGKTIQNVIRVMPASDGNYYIGGLVSGIVSRPLLAIWGANSADITGGMVWSNDNYGVTVHASLSPVKGENSPAITKLAECLNK